MMATAGNESNAVDLYNGATGAWSTAQLSVARRSLAATSVGNVAIFVGGSAAGVLVSIEGELWSVMVTCIRMCFMFVVVSLLLRVFALPALAVS
jgi:hypothetical protein